jgi:hypothetical protein
VLNFRTVINFPAEVFKYEKPTLVVQEILNMFILRPPPANPPVVGRNYFASKFEKNGDRVVFTTTVTPCRRAGGRTPSSGEPASVALGPLEGARQGEIRVAAVTLHADRQGMLSFGMSAANQTMVAKRTCRVHKGENMCYFDVPSEPVATLEVLPEGAGAESTILSVEIRSDAVAR